MVNPGCAHEAGPRGRTAVSCSGRDWRHRIVAEKGGKEGGKEPSCTS